MNWRCLLVDLEDSEIKDTWQTASDEHVFSMHLE